MRICVIDYGSGNLRSAARVFARAAQDHGQAEVFISPHAEDVRKADRLVLPGQGAFADCMKGLTAVPGMVEALAESVLEKGRPFFGICVGMQLLASRGHEHGIHKGLGWIGGTVAHLNERKNGQGMGALKFPHMGWNSLSLTQPGHPLLKDLPEKPFVYFVHSYALSLDQPAHELSSCDYGGPFPASVVKNNICGTQFHPEKSQKIGLQLIRNFLDWRP